ncbi:MAG: MBL fold metallo-hydrolase [Nitratireductor sp.]
MKNSEPNNLTRRQLCKVGFAGLAASMLPIPTLNAKTISLTNNISVKTVSDGNLSLPVQFLFPDIEKSKVEAILSANGMSTESLKPACNLTYLESGDKKILFDAGSGTNFMPSAGQLIASLEEIEVDVSDITDVIFTHGHPDHLWGILDDFDEITFPEANLYFPKTEWDFWRDETTASKMGEGREVFAVGAQNRLNAMEDQVQLFNFGDEVLPGIEAGNTSGHTPGHTSFVVHGKSDDTSIMILGDALTNHIVSFEEPSWPSGSDQDPQMGIETRLKLLDRLTTDKMQLAGFHLPNGGLGRVEKFKDTYKFISQE